MDDQTRFLRLVVVGAVVLLALQACAPAGPEEPRESSTDPEAAAGSASEAAAAGEEPPAWPWDRAASGLEVPASVPLEEIRPGGPPPDGIPPIDDPVFEPVATADEWLQPPDPVLVFGLGDDVRAYPLAILTYHEIVNDTVAGEPIVVTYCPLCNSGLVFERTVDGQVLDFGTSGRLWRSNLVMYDRATRSLWSQFTGEAIVGDFLGTKLKRLPLQIVSWDGYRSQHPDGRVLSRDTGHQRPYGNNPYVGYDSSGSPFLFDGETGGPLPQMERVVATGGDEDPVAYPLSLMERHGVVADTVAGEPVVVFWAPGTASALDRPEIASGRDIGATGVFRPIVDAQTLTFSPNGGGTFADAQTASTWNILGRAQAGPLAGTQLERIPHDDTFWFVQYAFRPDTRVVEST